MARPGIEPRTSDLRVMCLTDCAMRPDPNSTRHPVTCKFYTGYHGTSEIEHGLSARMVDNPLAKAHRLSLPTGVQTMLYISLGIADFIQSRFENRVLLQPMLERVAGVAHYIAAWSGNRVYFSCFFGVLLVSKRSNLKSQIVYLQCSWR